jgi:hypothetical protein
MKRLIKHIALMMIAATVFSVTGITVLYHTCGESGTTQASVLGSPGCMCESEAAIHESEPDIHACCALPAEESFPAKHINDDDCCMDRSERYAVNNSFMVQIFKYAPQIQVRKIEIPAGLKKIAEELEIKKFLDKSKYRLETTADFLVRLIRIYTNTNDSKEATS